MEHSREKGLNRMPRTPEPAYLLAGEVAALLHVSPKTVTRWARDGKLPHVRTLGGHRRFPADKIHALIDELTEIPDAG